MVIRNNVFHQIRRAINIENHPLSGPSRNIHVYHNTHFLDRDNGLARSWLFIAANNAGTGLVAFRTTLALHHSTDPLDSRDSSRLPMLRTLSCREQLRLHTEPHRVTAKRRAGAAHACTDPRLENTADRGSASFMRPAAGSPAIDTGVPVPVSEDFNGTPRPQGGALDVGAVERTQ